jgi:hypothetical protein
MSALIISLVFGACIVAATIGGSILALRAAARDQPASGLQGGDKPRDDPYTELYEILAAERASASKSSRQG